MKANEYFKKHGYRKCKSACAENGWLNTGFWIQLKRLVESHELVENFKCERYSGLSNAKDHLLTLAHIEEHAKLDRLRRAIFDVESCQ